MNSKFDLYFWIDTLASFLGIFVLILLFISIKKRIKTLFSNYKNFQNNQNKILSTEENELFKLADELYKKNKLKFDKARKKYFYIVSISLTFFSVLAYKLSLNFYDKKLFEHFIPSVKFLGSILLIITAFACIYRPARNNYKGTLGKLLIDNFLANEKFNLKYYSDFLVFNKQTHYQGNKHFETIEAYKKANFYNLPFSAAELEDYITGTYNDVNIHLCDAIFQRYNSRSNNVRRSLFFGNFTIIDLAPTNSQMKLVSKPIDENISLDETNQNKFDTYFTLASPNPENLENYFNDDFKSFLVDIRKKYNIRFDIIIKDKIYIQFHTQNMFEPSISSNPITPSTIYKYSFILKLIEKIIDHTKNFID